MRGTSAASLEAVRVGFEASLRAAGEQSVVLADQLYAVVDALLSSASLRRALSDPSRAAQDKAALVRQLLEGKAEPAVVDVMVDFAGARWSDDDDLVDGVEEFAAHAVLAAAEARGVLPEVEDELFRIDRMLIGQREVRRALVDRTASREARATLARTLLEGKAQPETVQLVARGAYEPRGRTMSAMLGRMGRLAARRRHLLVATVTAAAPLSPAQAERLEAMLEKTYGRPVRLAVAVDPQVLGGVRVKIGAQVVDATVEGRLDDVRRKLAG
ncbi:F0F1 ATP synthase subunit delta [Actinotalea sp. M2MS4P-6]|uniref:F0F1 ATP synthase subunit delta n=1 Tax=Actinotalea sp. M2MS4P-6 TaxID=2983762 RepID=UPI0021E37246|nr:F0F1 ATP synthase subunit delta [Actinotalea sp. M2MS4P-6]MCV2394084.1 F0F1 ATP synthase subunit delta [Actinotalea sp. M2MS4P-6]